MRLDTPKQLKESHLDIKRLGVGVTKICCVEGLQGSHIYFQTPYDMAFFLYQRSNSPSYYVLCFLDDRAVMIVRE